MNRPRTNDILSLSLSLSIYIYISIIISKDYLFTRKRDDEYEKNSNRNICFVSISRIGHFLKKKKKKKKKERNVHLCTSRVCVCIYTSMYMDVHFYAVLLSRVPRMNAQKKGNCFSFGRPSELEERKRQEA